MNIELHLFASLSKFRPKEFSKNPWIINCEENIDIKFLIEKLHLPKEEIKIIFINGKHASLKSQLNDGDRIGMFPPIGGG